MNLNTCPNAVVAAMHYFVTVMLCVIAVSTLTACTVTTAVWDDNHIRAPRGLPATLTAGQPAYIYFRRLDAVSRVDEDLKAWKATGFFDSVTQTESVEPVKSGVYISVDCKQTGHRDTASFDKIFAWLMTGFLMPAKYDEYYNNCTITYYQDTTKVAIANADVSFRQIGNGLGLIPLWLMSNSQETTLAQEAAAIRVTNMMKELAK